MNDAIINEYVHVHEINSMNFVWYEPLEHLPVTKGTLRGTIYFTEGRQIRFREGSNRSNPSILLIDCDDAWEGTLWNGLIVIRWKDRPAEHYLCVSYEIGEEKEKSVVCWQKEGF